MYFCTTCVSGARSYQTAHPNFATQESISSPSSHDQKKIELGILKEQQKASVLMHDQYSPYNCFVDRRHRAVSTQQASGV